MVGKIGLEGIVNMTIVSASLIGLIGLSACGYQAKPEPTRTLPPPEVHVVTFTPTATQPEPTYTPTATLAPTATETPVPTETLEPTQYLAPTEACDGEKKIVVDLSEQMTYAVIDYACSGRREFVNSSLSSTGVADHPTPINMEDDGIEDFSIWIKLVKTDMSGPGYNLKDVPFTMYFTEWGHGLHGTFWHNNFGHPMSHGCVNLPTYMAEWFFNWADVGTKVIVQP
jgi:hypothetical protein